MAEIMGVNRKPKDGIRFAIRMVALVTLLAGSGCGGEALASVRQVPGGDPQPGRDAIRAYGCGSCHTIPGIAGANATVGPPLTAMARREFIAGALPNTPENLVEWIMNPQAIEPGTAMPNLGVSEAEARNIAAYLYTLD